MWKMGIDNILYLASDPIDECDENMSPAFREYCGDSGIITMSDKEYKFGENVGSFICSSDKMEKNSDRANGKE